MKLSVLLILNENDDDDLRAVESIGAQTGEISSSDIFLVIAGKGLDTDRKQMFLEKSQKMGLTAFIDFTADNDAGLFNSFITHANADYCTVFFSGSSIDKEYYSGILSGMKFFPKAQMGMGRKYCRTGGRTVRDIFCPPDTHSGLIDLGENYGCLPRSFEGTLIRTDFAAAHLFDPAPGIDAEKCGIMMMLKDCGEFVYVSEVSLTGTRPMDDHSTYRYIYDEQWYTPSLLRSLLPLCDAARGEDGKIPLFIQYFVLRMLLCRFFENKDSRNKGVLLKKDAQTFLNTAAEVLKNIDDKVICNIHGLDMGDYDISLKRYLLGAKHGKKYYNFELSYDHDRLFAVCKDMLPGSNDMLSINVRKLSFSGNELHIEADYEDIFNSRRVKIGALYNNELYTVKYSGRYSATEFFGLCAYKNKCIHLSVPVNEVKACRLSFCIMFKGMRFGVRTSFSGEHSVLSGKNGNAYLYLDKKLICRNVDGEIWTEPAGRAKRFGLRAGSAAKAAGCRRLGTRLAYELSRPFFRKKNIWLFTDGVNKGGEAGELMFKYAMTRTDELYCYYLIDKKSEDSARLKSEGYKPLYSGGLISRLIYLNSKVIISSKPGIAGLNGFGPEQEPYFCDIPKAIRARVQDRACEELNAIRDQQLFDDTDIFFCGTAAAMEELKKSAYGYREDRLALSGLPGYEGLRSEEEPQKDEGSEEELFDAIRETIDKVKAENREAPEPEQAESSETDNNTDNTDAAGENAEGTENTVTAEVKTEEDSIADAPKETAEELPEEISQEVSENAEPGAEPEMISETVTEKRQIFIVINDRLSEGRDPADTEVGRLVNELCGDGELCAALSERNCVITLVLDRTWQDKTGELTAQEEISAVIGPVEEDGLQKAELVVCSDTELLCRRSFALRPGIFFSTGGKERPAGYFRPQQAKNAGELCGMLKKALAGDLAFCPEEQEERQRFFGEQAEGCARYIYDTLLKMQKNERRDEKK